MPHVPGSGPHLSLPPGNDPYMLGGLNQQILTGGGGATTPSLPGITYSTVDIGNGLVAVVDSEGNFWGIREAGGGGGGPAQSAMNDQRRLDQADARLNYDIERDQADLAEKRRQFDTSIGLERDRLAQEIRMLEMNLENNMKIAQLDSNTRLQIAKMSDETTRYEGGQNRALEARRIMIEGLGRDPVRQALFASSYTGGTTPVEAFNASPGQQGLLNPPGLPAAPPMLALPPPGGMPITATAQYGIGPVGNENILVGETSPEVVKVRGGQFQGVSPMAVSAPATPGQEFPTGPGGTYPGPAPIPSVPGFPASKFRGGATPNAIDALLAKKAGNEALANYYLRVSAGLEAWDPQKAASLDPLATLKLAIQKALEGRKGAFGDLPSIDIPGGIGTLPNPAAIARNLLRYRPSDPRLQLLLSGYGTAGISSEEALAMARAASPAAMFSGLVRAQ